MSPNHAVTETHHVQGGNAPGRQLRQRRLSPEQRGLFSVAARQTQVGETLTVSDSGAAATPQHRSLTSETLDGRWTLIVAMFGTSWLDFKIKLPPLDTHQNTQLFAEVLFL